jgi:hypothetical protein
MNEGMHNKISIGDKYWWWASGTNTNSIINLVFIRENAVFTMSCSPTFIELENLAKKIDNDIVKKVSYITFLAQ